ncbi:tRNA glutamyl-Q(34) synthetase GluQRS [Thiocapsa marina]|uniref:Glutamyl-Q tRNA(Asp) synthetase n=1 Tax=Thiocapsa marina 5811 TaxID=768671 RepID=F9U7W2_9GAMM|nr:tRNA glutamyl-Q(34) synthetase GluQRS [Thiocapsa marina]EGV19742.1 Glutamyl-Q tRNA(Asp) synthetase [Thiocapsa marina 5811]
MRDRSDPGPNGVPGHSAYRGRFAPSPTGPLHFGSLLAAMASYADARANRGIWLLRMEDLDRTREVPGAADLILRTLSALGFEWDEGVAYQSRRTDAYRDALDTLQARGLTYPCGCSRAEVARAGRSGLEGPVYPGTCRAGLALGRSARTERFRTPAGAIVFEDGIQGQQEQRVDDAVGDFVLRRADGIHAYQLAVVVDDALQGITRVVRGADLLLSTPRQILLQRALGFSRPGYAHVPLVLDANGRKLSKSLAAAPVDARDPLPALRAAWALLGQIPAPADLHLDAFWSWAIPEWRIARVPSKTAVVCPNGSSPRAREPSAHTFTPRPSNGPQSDRLQSAGPDQRHGPALLREPYPDAGPASLGNR